MQKTATQTFQAEQATNCFSDSSLIASQQRPKLTYMLQNYFKKIFDFLKKLSFENTHFSLTDINSSNYPSILYGIDAQDLSGCLEKKIDLDLITYNIENVSKFK